MPAEAKSNPFPRPQHIPISLVMITECIGPSSPVLITATPSSKLSCLMSMSKEVLPSGVLMTLQLLVPFAFSMAFGIFLVVEEEDTTPLVGAAEGMVINDGVAVPMVSWVLSELLVGVESPLPM